VQHRAVAADRDKQVRIGAQRFFGQLRLWQFQRQGIRSKHLDAPLRKVRGQKLNGFGHAGILVTSQDCNFVEFHRHRLIVADP
jgi:hypothetical protein